MSSTQAAALPSPSTLTEAQGETVRIWAKAQFVQEENLEVMREALEFIRTRAELKLYEKDLKKWIRCALSVEHQDIMNRSEGQKGGHNKTKAEKELAEQRKYIISLIDKLYKTIMNEFYPKKPKSMGGQPDRKRQRVSSSAAAPSASTASPSASPKASASSAPSTAYGTDTEGEDTDDDEMDIDNRSEAGTMDSVAESIDSIADPIDDNGGAARRHILIPIIDVIAGELEDASSKKETYSIHILNDQQHRITQYLQEKELLVSEGYITGDWRNPEFDMVICVPPADKARSTFKALLAGSRPFMAYLPFVFAQEKFAGIEHCNLSLIICGEEYAWFVGHSADDFDGIIKFKYPVVSKHDYGAL